ncbi:MAG TPA: DUF499 domain-containing protein [Candidatus Krumholzibacteria bacterium]|nr:DUF499 domain-containing protein [Candidatus Krumholzibacteria bacterium]HPD72977.1 DUF499 domain-containing protein [Candidatus Krumholzibacteria bacterium]HRY41776.1 DUF499 domain-containing protein [Candidatus Krumholzibacteria bacterium]
MALKPWYKVITPREDLREGRPLDASEFAVHLDQVRDGRAPAVYQNPADFFERTYLTKNLLGLAAEVIRRLSGVKVETSAVFNMTTQFGGGKTHALTLLYHLAQGHPETAEWKGVSSLLDKAGVAEIPRAATAVFVGTEFDSISGRGGADGTPIRKTPWGEIAWQLLGADGLGIVAEHEKTLTAPGGDVVSRILPADRPVLILLDELMNYVSRSRKSGLASQLYSFLHNLSEVSRSRDNVVLAVSIPASELEMTAEDQSDYERLKKLLDRLGKAVIMSAEAETSEIIRRRLFEWHGLPVDASKTVTEYAEWMESHRHQLPSWFPVDNAREALESSYPFHPSVLSVFERKWQALPRFQQTRGVLRLLALWVSHAYVEGFKGAHKDPLITLGTAPLADSTFRAAVFEQLGESRLEGAVTTDIAGKEHAHAVRLDKEATAEVKKARLHRKVATTIFFESNGGQHRGEATLPEVRLAVAEPDLDVGNVEQSLEALSDSCYFLSAEKNRFRFSFQPNLNKLLADRRASVPANAIRDRVRAEIERVFGAGKGVERVLFPERTNQVPDRAALTLVVLAPENEAGETATARLMETMAKEHGSSSRTYKSALIWCVAEDGTLLSEEARKVLAWEDIDADTETLRIDESQHHQLEENLKRAKRDLRESVWRTYKNVFLLDEKNALRKIDLGLVHSSAADSLVALILGRLKQEDLVVDGVSPNFLVRNWPPALPEWSTKAVRDAFFASPRFPRLVNPDAVKHTISRGVEAGMLAYVVRDQSGSYDPFLFRKAMLESELELADDVFIITKEHADAYEVRQKAGQAGLPSPTTPTAPSDPAGKPSDGASTVHSPRDPKDEGTPDVAAGFRWSGNLTPQKWMNFYTKVLAPFAAASGLTLTLGVQVKPAGGVSRAKIEEVRVSLRELGMSEDVETIKDDEG